jgi:hypothetical protein
MWTQVLHGQLVDGVMLRIGREMNIEFEQPSRFIAHTYPTGKWLYNEYGSSLDTEIGRWCSGSNRIVKGPSWTETDGEYCERLERELRVAVNDLKSKETKS